MCIRDRYITVQAITVNDPQVPTSVNVNPVTSLGVDYVSASLKNGNISDYNADYIGKYYNIIDLEDGEGGLYSEDELCIYVPTEITAKTHPHIPNVDYFDDHFVHIEYGCLWNGVGNSAYEHDYLSSALGSTSRSYFGMSYNIAYGGTYEWDLGANFCPEYSVLPNLVVSDGTGYNTGWFIWVRNAIVSDVGGGIPVDNESNHLEPNVVIPENTLMAMTHTRWGTQSNDYLSLIHI